MTIREEFDSEQEIQRKSTSSLILKVTNFIAKMGLLKLTNSSRLSTVREDIIFALFGMCLVRVRRADIVISHPSL